MPKFDEIREYLKTHKEFEGIKFPENTLEQINKMESILKDKTPEEKKQFVSLFRTKLEESGQNILVVGLMMMFIYEMFGLDKKELEEEFRKIDPEKIKSDIEEMKKLTNYKENEK